MNDRLDKIMQIAEELSHTRSQVETTMVGLKTQLRHLGNLIDQSVAELETQGVDASFNKLVDIEERAAVISRAVNSIKQQSASLEQALGYIKAAKRMSN
jgi:hypothetical protein